MDHVEQDIETMYALMRKESHRLKTFQMNPPWPKDYIDIKKLAKAGFFYAFSGDNVYCAFCRGQVHDWERDDDPMSEHARHFTTCPFIMGGDVGNEPLGEDPFPGPKRPRPYDVCGTFPNYPPNDPRNSNSNQNQNLQNSNNQSSDQQAALDQLTNGRGQQLLLPPPPPPQNQQSVASMAENNSSNYYNNNIMGNSNYQLGNGNHPQQPQQHYQRLPQPNALPPPPAHNDDLSTIMIENETSRYESPVESNTSSSSTSSNSLTGICKICYTNAIELLFLPCGHAVSCLSCATRLHSCPFCRVTITTRIRSYYI